MPISFLVWSDIVTGRVWNSNWWQTVVILLATIITAAAILWMSRLQTTIRLLLLNYLIVSPVDNDSLSNWKLQTLTLFLDYRLFNQRWLLSNGFQKWSRIFLIASDNENLVLVLAHDYFAGIAALTMAQIFDAVGRGVSIWVLTSPGVQESLLCWLSSTCALILESVFSLLVDRPCLAAEKRVKEGVHLSIYYKFNNQLYIVYVLT